MNARKRPLAFVLVLAVGSLAGMSYGPHLPHALFDAPCACPTEIPAPVVTLRLCAPAVAGVGQEVPYRILVENRSPAPAHHVAVRNAVPAHARFIRAHPEPAAVDPEILWQVGTLPPGVCCEITLVLSPTGTGDVKNCARVQYEHGQCTCTKVGPSAATAGERGLTLRKLGPNQAAINETLRYQLIVTNNGDVEAEGVVLTDVLPAGLEHESRKNTLTWDMGNLPPGQTRTVDYQVVARQAGRLTNAAVATAAGGIRRAVEHSVQVGEARLSLTKTGPSRRYLNMPAEYRITVTNSGTTPLANVTISDPIPTGLAYVSSSRGGEVVGTEVRWAVGNLEPGMSRTVEVTMRGQQVGTVQNRVTATSGATKADAEATTEFFGASALLLELVDNKDPVEVGGETSYVIIVRNQGNVPVNDIRLSANVPTELELARVAGPLKHTTEGQIISFEPLSLQPQTDSRIEIFTKAKSAGDVRFKVEMSAKELSAGPVQEEESTTIFSDLQSLRNRAVE
jgi:uncharacterized repeat protein (TIGR01451 family)